MGVLKVLAIGSMLAPPSFVGLHHRTGSDTIHYLINCGLDLSCHTMNDSNNAPHAQVELMHCLQIPLDGA